MNRFLHRTIFFGLLILGSSAFSQYDMGLQPGPFPPEPSSAPPTYANIPEPKHVLVVYKFNDSTLVSRAVADAYVAARSIPTMNLVGLVLPNDYPIGSDHAYLAQNREEIRGNDSLGWIYYRDKIATQLETYLSTNINTEGDTLKNVIRYIVFCKGIPHKVRSLPYFWAWSVRKNVSTDALACLLFQNVLVLYRSYYGSVSNPFGRVDPNITLDFRFLPNHFVTAQGWKLSYLVTRLDGDDYQDVNAMIQSSLQPDVSGKKWRILDDDPCTHVESYMQSTFNKLNSLGFTNVKPTPFVKTLSWIADNPNGEVIGYTSFGNNAGRDSVPNPPCYPNIPRMPMDYVLNTLNFQYANGALFHTLESFNGWTFSHYRSDDAGGYVGQALIEDFIHRGGTGGEFQTYEPYNSFTLGRADVMHPAYAMGYPIVDAIYQSIPYLAWQSAVLGDPLVAIARGKQTLTQSQTWSGTNLVTGTVIIPSGKSLTLDNAIVNTRGSSAQLDVRGVLALAGNQSSSVNGSGVRIIVRSGGRLELSNKATLAINDCELLVESGGTVAVNYDALLVDNGRVTMQGGTTFQMGEEAQIQVPGYLTASGSSSSHIQFIAANAGVAWKGIAFTGSHTSSMEYADISDARIAIETPHTNDLSVTNCTITGGEIGIHLFDPLIWEFPSTIISSNYFTAQTQNAILVDINASSVLIQDNTIDGQGITPTGIYFVGSSPLQVARNHISGCNVAGIFCEFASPSFTDGENGGRNCATGNQVGFWAYNDSNPMLGLDHEMGLNTIAENSGYQIVLQEKCDKVFSIWNFYRPGGPDPNADFSIDESSSLLYEPYLIGDENQCTGGQMNITGEPKSGSGSGALSNGLLDNPEITQAVMLRLSRQHVEAIDQLKTVIAANRNDVGMVRWALHEMLANYQLVPRPSNPSRLSGYVRGLLGGNSNNEIKRAIRNVVASALMHEADEGTLAALNDVISFHPNTPSEVTALFAKVNLAVYGSNDSTVTARALNALQARYPDNRLTRLAEVLVTNTVRGNSLVGPSKQGGVIANTIQVPSRFAIHPSYPNPFNPSTTIRFDLPEPARVSLVVYDVLGRKVSELVNSSKEAGYHSAVWNASGVASGVYFARFMATDMQGNVKLSKVSKLLLAK